jgi:lycopene cyclase domain-containing protein
MPEYTVIAIVVATGVVCLERFWLRTGLFRDKRYWIAMAIVAFFQTLVDGWLTKRPDPIVAYNEDFNTGIRFPGSIPIEDWLFGFAMVTLALLCWVRSTPHVEASGS